MIHYYCCIRFDLLYYHFNDRFTYQSFDAVYTETIKNPINKVYLETVLSCRQVISLIFHKCIISLNSVSSLAKYRSCHRRCSKKVGVLKNFSNVTGKHLCWSLFLIKFQTGLKAYNFIKKRPQYRYFPVKFVKFLRTPTLKNICK